MFQDLQSTVEFPRQFEEFANILLKVCLCVCRAVVITHVGI